MADKTIGELTSIYSVEPTSLFVAEQSGKAVKISGESLSNYFKGKFSEEEIRKWLDEHPEATTTVQDGSISIPKLAEDTKGLFYHPNLLDNWYFGNPVNQRGQTEYTGGNVYTIDRWITLGANSLFSVLDKGVRIARKTDGDKGRITQSLSPELRTALAGKTCTLSVLINSFPKSGYTGLFILWDNVALSEVQIKPDSASKLISTTFRIPDSMVSANNADYRVQISTNATGGDSVELAAVKLELGSVQTLAHQDEDGNWVLNEIPNYAEELAKCQRYQLKLIYGTSQNYAPIGFGFANNTTSIRILIPTPATMRAAPTLSYLSGSISGLTILCDGKQLIPESVNTVNVLPYGVALMFTVSNATSSAPCVLRATSAYCILDANL